MNRQKGFLRLTLILSIIVGILLGVIGYILEEQKVIKIGNVKIKSIEKDSGKTVYEAMDTITDKKVIFKGYITPNRQTLNNIFAKKIGDLVLVEKKKESPTNLRLLQEPNVITFDELYPIGKLRKMKWSEVTAEPRYINAPPKEKKYIQEDWYNKNIISDPRYKPEDDAQIRRDIFDELYEILPRQGIINHISCFYSVTVGILWLIIGFISVWTIYAFIRWCIMNLITWIIAGFKEE